MSLVSDNQIAVSILFPCLNESETIVVCIQKAKIESQKLNIPIEIVVAELDQVEKDRVVHSTKLRAMEKSIKELQSA